MDDATKTILIVDDEVYIRQSLADFFEDRLWQTLPTESGEQALEVLERESAQAAIVDIRMGGMNGDQFIRRASEKYPDMAFVICTGSPEYYLPRDLQELPCVSNRVFRKPVANLAELEAELMSLTGS